MKRKPFVIELSEEDENWLRQRSVVKGQPGLSEVHIPGTIGGAKKAKKKKKKKRHAMVKHYGPGDHETGTSQDVHGSGGGGTTSSATSVTSTTTTPTGVPVLDYPAGPLSLRDEWEKFTEALGVHDWGFDTGDIGVGANERQDPVMYDVVRNQFHNISRENERPIDYMFRAISNEDWERIQAQGYIDTSGEMNLDPDEGLNSANDLSTFYLPKIGAGRVIRIDYRPEDGWKVDPADGYIKTHSKVPIDRISMVTPIVEGRIMDKRHNLADEYPDVFGDRRYRSTELFLLEPGQEPTHDEFALTPGDVRRQYGDHYMGGYTPGEDGEPEWVEKHGGGSHNDEDHGNWADGISQEDKADAGTQTKLEGVEAGPRASMETQFGMFTEEGWEDEEAMWEFRDATISDWQQWQGCRDIREAAAEIAGVDDSEQFEIVDPHVELDASIHVSGAWASPPAENPYFEAKFMMEQLVDGETFYDLYRGIGNLSGDDLDDFLELAQPGATIDAPLLSFANQAVVGENNIVADYGDDILLHVEGPTTGFDTGVMTDPIWSERDEDQWLNDLTLTITDSVDYEEEPELYEQYQELSDRIDAHIDGKSPLNESDRYEIDSIYGGEGYTKWAGEKIDEVTNSEAYYDYMEYGGDTVNEIVSGGRFRVISVEKGSGDFDDFGYHITVEQIGVYDPFNEGALIQKFAPATITLTGGALTPMSVAQGRKARNEKAESEAEEPEANEEIEKHYGPGPHPSGTPQSVHGGPKRLPMDRLQGVDWSEYGIEHPEIADRAFWDDWSPVMHPEEAEEMLAAHGLTHIYYGAHATADPDAVLREGFQEEDIGSNAGTGWGKGLYMVHEGAADYYETALNYSTIGTSIRVAMGFENPLEVWAEDPSEATYEAMQYGPSFGAMLRYTGPGTWPLDHYKIITEWAELEWDPEWEDAVMYEATGDSPPWSLSTRKYPGLHKVLSDAGYDGLIINAPRDFPIEFDGHFSDEEMEAAAEAGTVVPYDPSWARSVYGGGQPAPGTGGSQIIVFDPQHSAIVGVTEFTDNGYAGSPDTDDDIVRALTEVSKSGVTGVTDDMVRQVYGPWLTKLGDRRGPGSPLRGGRLAKHYGPGPHKSGSPQSVHGGGATKASEPVDPTNMAAMARKAEEAADAARRERKRNAFMRVRADKARNARFEEMGEKYWDLWGDESEVTLHEDMEHFGDIHRLTEEQAAWMEEFYPDEYEELLYEDMNGFWNRHAARNIWYRAEKWNMTTDDVAAAVAKMDEFLENAHPFIRLDSSVFGDMLSYDTELTLKNQLETGSSSGWYDPQGRLQVDKILFGINHEYDGGDRSPTYGYMMEESGVWSSGDPYETLDYDTALHAEPLEHYGQVAFQLRDDVNMTFTSGDSLDDTGVMLPGFFGGGGVVDEGGLMGDTPKMTIGTPGYVVPSDIDGPIYNMAESGVPSTTRYVEAQFHEEINYEDVVAIHLPKYVLEETSLSVEEMKDIVGPGIEIVVAP